DQAKCDKPQSGIQLIDWADDSLALRAVAPQHGSPRRAFLNNGTLFGISDDRVSSFDIADRSNPKKLDDLSLINPAHRAVAQGDHIVQLSHDWFAGTAEILVTSKANVNGEPIGRLDLSELAI